MLFIYFAAGLSPLLAVALVWGFFETTSQIGDLNEQVNGLIDQSARIILTRDMAVNAAEEAGRKLAVALADAKYWQEVAGDLAKAKKGRKRV